MAERFTPDWFSRPGDTIAALLARQSGDACTLAAAMGKDKAFVLGLICGAERIDDAIAGELVKEGQAITVVWRGKPVFIRNRTPEEVKKAVDVKLSDLSDGSARNDDLPDKAPATDANRTKKGHENWIILVGICTHLGCIPKGQGLNDARGDYGGWFCPCHGSHYDTAGRIRKGPAPRNLEVPPYAFTSNTKIKIG